MMTQTAVATLPLLQLLSFPRTGNPAEKIAEVLEEV
jgi:hypothetical protein